MASTVNVGVIFYAPIEALEAIAKQGSGLRLCGLSCANVLG